MGKSIIKQATSDDYIAYRGEIVFNDFDYKAIINHEKDYYQIVMNDIIYGDFFVDLIDNSFSWFNIKDDSYNLLNNIVDKYERLHFNFPPFISDETYTKLLNNLEVNNVRIIKIEEYEKHDGRYKNVFIS